MASLQPPYVPLFYSSLGFHTFSHIVLSHSFSSPLIWIHFLNPSPHSLLPLGNHVAASELQLFTAVERYTQDSLTHKLINKEGSVENELMTRANNKYNNLKFPTSLSGWADFGLKLNFPQNIADFIIHNAGNWERKCRGMKVQRGKCCDTKHQRRHDVMQRGGEKTDH